VGEVNELTIYLNSPGGSVIEGLNIYNLIKRVEANTTIIITGLAASMGSVIAMAADNIEMAEGSLMMIHNPWGGAWGEADELRKVANVLDKMKASLIGTYHAKTTIDRDKLAELMNAETWMDATEAHSLGFINSIRETVEPENCLSIDDAKALTALACADTNKEMVTYAAATNKTNFKNEGRNPQSKPKEESNTMDEIEKEKAALKARNEAINTLFAKHPLLNELKAECLSDIELSIEDVQAKALDALSASDDNKPVGGFVVLEDAKDKSAKGMTLALSARAGLEKDATENEFRGYSLTEMARHTLRTNGVPPTGDKMAFIGQAFTHSSSDFGNILSNVANKAMLKGFEESPETFDQFTGVGSLPDFKKSTRTDLGHAPSLREVKPGAEFKQITFTDSKAEAMLATYGEIFGINRQTVINDDLGAFTRIPSKMGRAARRTVGDLVFAQLMLPAHYSSANQLTSNPMNSANLDALRVKMITRKAADDKTVTGVRPAFLIVPEALRGTATQAIESEFMISADEASRQPNIARNMAQVISDYRLDADDVARYYLLASAAMYDALEVQYLDGNSNPFLDQMAGWNIDGTQFKVRIDAAAKLWDNRSVARAK